MMNCFFLAGGDDDHQGGIVVGSSLLEAHAEGHVMASIQGIVHQSVHQKAWLMPLGHALRLPI